VGRKGVPSNLGEVSRLFPDLAKRLGGIEGTHAVSAVEFSYRYGDRGGRYGGRTARRAFDIFQAIQRDLLAWVDPTPRTKTALVFG
jgi:hypothetical protein